MLDSKQLPAMTRLAAMSAIVWGTLHAILFGLVTIATLIAFLLPAVIPGPVAFFYGWFALSASRLENREEQGRRSLQVASGIAASLALVGLLYIVYMQRTYGGTVSIPVVAVVLAELVYPLLLFLHLGSPLARNAVIPEFGPFQERVSAAQQGVQPADVRRALRISLFGVLLGLLLAALWIEGMILLKTH